MRMSVSESNEGRTFSCDILRLAYLDVDCSYNAEFCRMFSQKALMRYQKVDIILEALLWLLIVEHSIGCFCWVDFLHSSQNCFP